MSRNREFVAHVIVSQDPHRLGLSSCADGRCKPTCADSLPHSRGRRGIGSCMIGWASSSSSRRIDASRSRLAGGEHRSRAGCCTGYGRRNVLRRIFVFSVLGRTPSECSATVLSAHSVGGPGVAVTAKRTILLRRPFMSDDLDDAAPDPQIFLQAIGDGGYTRSGSNAVRPTRGRPLPQSSFEPHDLAERVRPATRAARDLLARPEGDPRRPFSARHLSVAAGEGTRTLNPLFASLSASD